VPPLNEVVVESVELWLLSMVPGPALMTGAVGIRLTVTVAGTELTVTGVGVLSVTRRRKCHVPAVVNVPVEIVGVSVMSQTNMSPRWL